MGKFWETGSGEIVLAIVTGAFTIAFWQLITSRADKLSTLVNASSTGFVNILKASSGQ